MTRRTRVVDDKPEFQIIKQSSTGSGRGPTYLIHLKDNSGAQATRRKVEVTVDQLFDLAEALDDLCDFIEDNDTGSPREKNTDCNEEKLVV